MQLERLVCIKLLSHYCFDYIITDTIVNKDAPR